MARKYIFLDIDGTLTVPFQPPTPRVQEAIHTARRSGHKVFLSTGRNIPFISQDVLDVGFDGIVASAGSHIEAEGQVIYDDVMPEELVQEIISVFHRFNVSCRIESAEGVYTDTMMDELVRSTRPEDANSEMLRMICELEAHTEVHSYDEYPRNGAYKVCFTCTDIEDVERTKPFLADRFSYVIFPHLFQSRTINGEIIRNGINKGTAIWKVCDFYGAPLSDTIVFGDSMNDYDMFGCAGHAVAMDNACDELKQAADTVCESVEQDGIYHEFRRLTLI